MSPQMLVKGIVSRLLPQQWYDDRDADKPIRLLRYGEQATVSFIRKQYALIDEGCYFIAHNAQTGIVSSLLGTAFAETTLSPYIIITNMDVGDKGKTIFLDYLNLICTVVGAAASALTTMQFAWTLDQVATRWASGGTDLTGTPASGGGIINPNSGVSKRNSIAQINIGALTLNAASALRRIVIPQRLLRVQNSATVAGAVQDEAQMNFGAVEHNNPSSLTDISTAKTVAYREYFQLPGLEIAPGHCAVLHLWVSGGALTTGITYLPEFGYYER